MPPLSYYLNPAYLLDQRPDPLGPTGRVWLPALVLGCLGLGVALRWFAASRTNPLTKAGLLRVSRPLLVMGSVGVVYAGLAYQAVPLLSMRLWLLLWLLTTAAWLTVVAINEWRTQPAKQTSRQERLERERYLRQ